MKLAYIYYSNIKNNHAHITQTFSMCQSLAKHCELDFYSGYHRKRTICERLNFLNLAHNFKFRRLPIPPATGISLLDNFLRLKFYAFVLLKLYIHKYDAVYTRDFGFIYFLSFFPGRAQKMRILYEPHKVYSLASEKFNSITKEVGSINTACDHVFPLTSLGADDLQDHGVTVPMTVLPDSADTETYMPANAEQKKALRKSLGLPTDKTVILYAGTFKPWKGVETFIEAAHKLKDPDLVFIAVGADKEEFPRFKEMIQTDDPSVHIELRGMVGKKDLSRYMRMSDIGIVPTTSSSIGQRYTSPLKLFEYMCSGLPVIASNLPALRSQFSDDDLLYFNTGSAEDLADKILLLKKDTEMYTQYAQRHLMQKEKYTWDHRAQVVLNIIKT